MKSYDEIIVKYFDNQLSSDERSAFEKELEVNSDLQSSFDEYKKVNDTFSKSDKVLVSQEYFNTTVDTNHTMAMSQLQHSHLICGR